MNDEFSTGLTGVAFAILIPSVLVLGIIIGAMTEGPRERDKAIRDKAIIYCIDSPDKCKIEYTYLKLKETQNENPN